MDSWYKFSSCIFYGTKITDLDITNYEITSDGSLYIHNTVLNAMILPDSTINLIRYPLSILANEKKLYDMYFESNRDNGNDTFLILKYRLNRDELILRVKNRTGFKNRQFLKNNLHNIIGGAFRNTIVPYEKIIKKIINPVKYDIVPKEQRNFPHLMSFQEHNVNWMLSVEKNLSKEDLYYEDHPYLKISSYDKKTQVYYDKVTELFIDERTDPKKFRFCGGALIDEMGCGKTACAITLCLSSTPKQIDLKKIREEKKLPMSDGRIKSRASLIIVPNHISNQWIGEIKKFNFRRNEYTPTIISISSVRDYREYTYADLINADFVIMTYQYLQNQSMVAQLAEAYEYMNNDKNTKNKSSDLYEKAIRIFVEETSGNFDLLDKKHVNLFHFKWNRIILDECQEWMSSYTFSTKWYLNQFFDSKYKWCLSGTPFEAKSNLYTIFGFLTKQYKNSTKLLYNKSVLYHVLSKNIYRRNTVESTMAETPLKDIKIIEKTIWIKFTKQERLIYQSKIAGKARETFLRQFCCSPFTPMELDKCKTFGDIMNEMKKNLEEPLKRNIQDHHYYVKTLGKNQVDLQNAIARRVSPNIISDLERECKKLEKKRNATQESISTLESSLKYYDNLKDIMSGEVEIECPICYGNIEEDNEDSMSMTKCGHVFCTECINETLNSGNNRLCPTCRNPLGCNDVYVVSQSNPDQQQPEEDNSEYAQLYKKVGSKIARLIMYIKETLKDPSNNIILFAEWEDVMFRIGNLLQSYGIKTAVCKGNKYSREAAIKRFNTMSDHRIIMLSSAYASHGTNLTKANKIIIVNPVGGTKKHREDIEAQAVARSYRLGQTRNLEVIRFVIKDSIEEKMYNETFNEEDNENIIVVE